MPVLTYLNFNGNCREVLEFYRSVFGGEYHDYADVRRRPG